MAHLWVQPTLRCWHFFILYWQSDKKVKNTIKENKTIKQDKIFIFVHLDNDAFFGNEARTTIRG
ncbi:hypothetical protein HMPREF2811_01685 [Globicatella sp. HMSC072A10]|uniref:hypothetical protein n=1 Tax=Globicatella sp. HMSC072A10 TaxID=1739315 RepID=UPI0008D60205|nr:hypothetical protein [Globicatella sp. HMSC072A10]OFK56570.1 hypothetical protein HMPREF2811_01685 [Globicatella sp. HMSC072A10]